MTSIRTLAAAIAALAVLGLYEAEATAQPVTSKDDADLSAPEPAPSITLVLPKAALLESLVAAAESGNVDAMNLLGVLYTTGTQVSRDTSMALHWFQKAIDGGSADAMDNVATMYLLGIGVSRDAVNALRWFVHSAARGNVHSICSVAVGAENGLGTARNLQLFRAMYRRAAESGFTPAMLRVSDSYARGLGAKRDLVEAYAWLQVALQSGLREEPLIAALASIEDLERRLGPERRDEARVRATRITALVRTRALPAEDRAPAAMQLSSRSNEAPTGRRS